MSAEDYIPFPVDFDEDGERAREALGEDNYPDTVYDWEEEED